MGLMPDAGRSKDDVNYRICEECQTCMHFYPLNSCELVAGNISPKATCDLWEIKGKDEGKDASFYMEQFNKGK